MIFQLKITLARFTLIGAAAFIISACGTFEVGTEPTTEAESLTDDVPTVIPTIVVESIEEAPDEVLEAFYAALDHINEYHGEQVFPPVGEDWQVENITPQDRVGMTTFQFRTDNLVSTVALPLVSPDATIYHISVNDQGTGFQWEGEVDAQGSVSELSVSGATAVVPEEVEVPVGLTALDDTWNQYTNAEVGFSMNLPRMMMAMNGACVWNEERGSYQWEMGLVPVTVFEDSDAVYIAGESFFQLGGRREEATSDGGVRVFYDACDRMTNSLDLLRDPDNYYQQMWKLAYDDDRSKADIERFLQDRYGTSCSLGELVATSQEGVFDVTILGDGKSLEETQCPLNFGTVVKWYPAEKTIIAWDTGQAYTFPADETNSVTYDQSMVDSFRFLTAATTEEPGSSISPDAAEEIADWWGVIHSTEAGAQFDDYFERQDLGQIIYFGIESHNPVVQEQIEAQRDSGQVVHLYGTLLSNVLDYNGSQILVDRIETEVSAASLPEDSETYINNDFGFSFEYPASWELSVIDRRPLDDDLGSLQWLADVVLLSKDNLDISIQYLHISEPAAWDGRLMAGPFQEAVDGEPLNLIGEQVHRKVWIYDDHIKGIEIQAVNPDADLVVTITMRDSSGLIIEDPRADALSESDIAVLDRILNSFELTNE